MQEDISEAAINNARQTTNSMLDIMTDFVGDSRDHAIIAGNSAITAVSMLFNKHGIHPDEAKESFDLIWKKFLEELK